MNRYDFFNSIQQSVPMFFPEIKDVKNLSDIVFVDHTTNKLLFSITFHMLDSNNAETFLRSDFEGKLKKFKAMLMRLGIQDMEDLIEPVIENKFKIESETELEADPETELDEERKYFFLIPAEISLKFTD